MENVPGGKYPKQLHHLLGNKQGKLPILNQGEQTIIINKLRRVSRTYMKD